MTVKTNHTFDNTVFGVFSEVSNNFVAAIADILTASTEIVMFTVTAAKIWHARSAQRNHLLELDNRQLDDIGLNRGQALQEANKPFWRA